ncbi:MAG: hypothetical protein ABW321_06275, partial [Polyangiales bacterium]
MAPAGIVAIYSGELSDDDDWQGGSTPGDVTSEHPRPPARTDDEEPAAVELDWDSEEIPTRVLSAVKAEQPELFDLPSLQSLQSLQGLPALQAPPPTAARAALAKPNANTTQELRPVDLDALELTPTPTPGSGAQPIAARTWQAP